MAGINQSDLGILGDLAEALGIFRGGSPNADWFPNPDTYLKDILADSGQRAALLRFVDAALGGADNTVQDGVIWVPLLKVPDSPLTVAMTVDENQTDGVHVGVGLKVVTAAPVASISTLSIPLFCARAEGKSPTGPLVLLGSARGRIQLSSTVTLPPAADANALRLAGIGLTMALPTGPGAPATFGLALRGLQMPGAAAPRDVRVEASNVDALDDALLDLVLGLVKAQADAAGAPAAVQAFGGLLGLRSNDSVPDFPLAALLTQGVRALADWVLAIVQNPAVRDVWLGHIGSLLGGTPVGPEVQFNLGLAQLSLALSLPVATDASGHTLLKPRLSLRYGSGATRVQASADSMRIDLVTGVAVALPALEIVAASGTAASPVLNVAAAPPAPAAQAQTLRVGFALDASRKLVFVLAADQVTLGSHNYAVLDLTSPSAVMDALGHTVADVANQLLAQLGSALGTAQQLLGLAPPAGFPALNAVTLPALMADPVGAVAGYWQQLVGTPVAMSTVLQTLRQALADATQAAAVVQGAGTRTAPWRLALIGPLGLDVFAEGSVLSVALAARTEVDSLGQRCTVVSTRVAATLARLDLAARSATLLPDVTAQLSLRERGVNPPSARLALAGGGELLADGVGLGLSWSPGAGLQADASLPNPRWVVNGIAVPLALPHIDASGNVSLPPAGWDAVQVLVGHLAQRLSRGAPCWLAEVTAALGWDTAPQQATTTTEQRQTLRLADWVSNPTATLQAWLPAMLRSDIGPQALSLVADLFAGSGALRAVIAGRGTPDAPYRIVAHADLPELLLWFPPAGLEPTLVAAPEALREWLPGAPALAFETLESALWAEAEVDAAVADLLLGRADLSGTLGVGGMGRIGASLEALVQRFAGGDGRIAPPPVAPAGVGLRLLGLAAGQLWAGADLEDTLGRVATTTVHVALGAPALAWPDALAATPGRVLDLSTAGLEATMFTLPAAAAGDWFVALGTRADCLLATSTGDGTAEQAARLSRWVQALAAVSNDIALVAVAGAGHAARWVADAQAAVSDLVLLGTPLAAISLTALDTQPTADALRLLQRLLPAPPSAAELAADEDAAEDSALALGRALVQALMELTALADPAADLRPPLLPAPAVRAGLVVAAVFGSVSATQVRAAFTAIVAAGLAARARLRAQGSGVAAAVGPAGEVPPALESLPLPSGLRAGLRWHIPARTGGQLAVQGQADLSLLAHDFSLAPAPSLTRRERVLRVRLSVFDRSGWLASTPSLALRAVSLDLTLPLDGVAVGTCLVTLHDATLFGQSWERLRLGHVPSALGSAGLAQMQAVLPEARVLLASFAQRLVADVGGASQVALADVLEALGLLAPSGGIVATAWDQLVFDPGGLVRQRLQLVGGELQTALAALLGPLAVDVDWAARSVALQGGGATAGRFGWSADVLVAPTGVSGSLSLGPDAALPLVGGLRLQLGLQPFTATLMWQRSLGVSDTAPLWPAPDVPAVTRMLAHALPSLVAQVALELMRRADASARPVIDAALDALGLLQGTATGTPADAQRALQPLVGLLRDPLNWLGHSAALAAQPARIQALFDALRPLMGLGGAAGSPLPLATGVSLAVTAVGAGARLALNVDPSGWAAANAAAPRLAGGIGASLLLLPGQVPVPGMVLNLGLSGAPAGRQAVHAAIGTPGGLQVFLRPLSGADIPLVPFAGLGALSAVAQAALPFLLDRLAERPAPVGPLVAKLGDALALRVGAPAAFSGPALTAWAAQPVEKLRDAAAAGLSSLLVELTPLVNAFLPAGLPVALSATHTGGTLEVAAGGFKLGYRPANREITLTCSNLVVPGIDKLNALVAVNDSGLRELSFTLGPAAINTGGVFIRPFVTVAAGLAPAGGARVLVGLASGSSIATGSVAARWLLNPAQFALVDGSGAVADAADFVALLIDLAAAVAMAQQAVKDLLDSPVQAGFSVRQMLAGVLLNPANTSQLITQPFEPAQIPGRIRKLIDNLAVAVVKVDLGDVTLSFRAIDGSLGLQIELDQRFPLIEGDVSLWLENDDSWISPDPTGNGGKGGLFVGFMPQGGNQFRPKLVVNGLGLRLGKTSGPLIDAGLTIESVALHAYAAIDATGITGGGVQLQFANLAVGTGSAGGSNGIAQGVLRDTGPQPPQPAFSPALAVQKHGNGAVAVSLRAGDPPGPWWIAIQRGFGPLYLEQVGFDARLLANGKLERVSVLMDGSVSMFGLTCAVDDLQVTYFTTGGDFLNAANWHVDLAGLAVAADMAGLSIAGGLLKQETTNAVGQKQTEYLGMLLGRFAVYGLTIYGGYGEGVDATTGQKFTAFFAIGAVNGPIGGPPAFFLTGIGGGLGINRKLLLPPDLSKFGDYPLIQALDIAASPADPMAQLRQLGSYFPMSKGTFWFAAGLSFTSFALVDGIAVVGVQIGDGLDINLLGLARMALPRPQVALVSIEVALIVRFSSSEGVLWVQGQLTDNSWLLYPDIKLTGGFAYVIWFAGERQGEFVLTLGGYHPDFSRPGYPVVPRLGLRWSIGSSIVIKAGSYFALTSEALMAGGDFEASATFGPAWAEVKFGAHGIVYFDPFSYHVNAYARISAGITIDTWIFGEVTISISLGARIDVKGPDFRGSVTFEVGPVELTFDFGGNDKAGYTPISADAFIDKYLERAPASSGSGALVHALMTASGAQPSKGEDATPDGSAARPFVVVVEFGLTFTSTVPATRVTGTGLGASTPHAPSKLLYVGPMGSGVVEPEIVLTWQQGGAPLPFPFAITPRPFGRFPRGIWGPAGDPNNRKVPKAEMVSALNELDLLCTAAPSGGGPEIPYFQVETNKRLPLPFSKRLADINQLRASAKGITALVSQPTTVAAAFAGAGRFLARTASPTALAALRGERQAPPRAGTLTEGLESPVRTTVPQIAPRPPRPVFDHAIDAPVVVALFSAATADLSVASKARTTVKGSERAWRVAPPTLAGVMAERSRSVPARLVLAQAPAVPVGKNGDTRRPATLIGAAELPLTAVAHAPTALVRRSGAGLAAPLAQFNAALVAAATAAPNVQPALTRSAAQAAKNAPVAQDANPSGAALNTTGNASRAPGAALTPGQCVVLQLPNAAADAGSGERPALAVANAPARVVLLDTAGQILADQLVGPPQAGDPEAALPLPRGTACIVAIGQGLSQAPADQRTASAPRRTGLWGWHAGLRMPYVGQGSAVGPGCVLRSSTDSLAAHRERAQAGWVSGAELARGVTTVSTRFAATVQTVVVIVDDPAVTGLDIGQRQLLLGLDGAVRATDAAGTERAPVLLTMDNRSMLAYEVKPVLQADGQPRPVVVTVASQEGWSLVGVMAAPDLDPQAALNLIAARGLQAALQALAPRVLAAADGGVASVLRWQGPVRSAAQRRAATASANGIVPPPAPRANGIVPLPAPRALGGAPIPRRPRQKER